MLPVILLGWIYLYPIFKSRNRSYLKPSNLNNISLNLAIGNGLQLFFLFKSIKSLGKVADFLYFGFLVNF